jgi:hypothetical protein
MNMAHENGNKGDGKGGLKARRNGSKRLHPAKANVKARARLDARIRGFEAIASKSGYRRPGSLKVH